MVLKSCPFCHRPFDAELLSKEQIESRELTKFTDSAAVYSMGGQMEQGGLYYSMISGPTEDERAAVAMHPEAFLTHRSIYKCKHCGKEWAKISVEEIPLPREYVEDEERDEKSDYDAHVEEEEAREEEYDR